jgi:hypothetical protein
VIHALRNKLVDQNATARSRLGLEIHQDALP